MNPEQNQPQQPEAVPAPIAQPPVATQPQAVYYNSGIPSTAQSSVWAKHKKLIIISVILSVLLMVATTGAAIKIFMDSEKAAQNQRAAEEKAEKEKAAAAAESEKQKLGVGNEQPKPLTPAPQQATPSLQATAEYPDQVRTAFMDNCVANGGNQNYCTCVLNSLERDIPYSQFEKMSNDLVNANDEQLLKVIEKYVPGCL